MRSSFLISRDFDEAAARGHVGVWGVHLVSNGLGAAEIDVRDRMRLRRLRSEANIMF
jgi:hypothetical protein